ncbi:MAG: RIP metalloprotease RseP [Deltaproteobacteria bacterium]|jgi:regulator of sigma E protease|nr:RIP metalloprotease RseP [Deltaproteobacteria bacterium]MBW2520787.1 RIP metalloprotease RseP [Deltaproteobacteria bacterium]
MITVAAGIIMLGILVFVHELGHFCVAKFCGVKVLKFSLGFGPKLVSKRWGETEYMICAVPLGGYVQMLGEGGGEQGEDASLDPEEEHRSFAKQSVSRRMAIVAAGPLMNLMLPFIVMPLAYMVGINLPAYLEEPACIGYVFDDSEADRSGFQVGDCIAEINGVAVPTWTATGPALVNHAGEAITFTIIRDDQMQTIALEPHADALEGLQSIGLFPRQEAIVGHLAPDMPAIEAGMQVGDRVLAIDGRQVNSWYDLKEIIQTVGGQPIDFVVLRDNTEVVITITPRLVEDSEDFLIGIAPQQHTVFKQFGLVDAFQAGAERTMGLIDLTLVFIKKLFSGHVSTENIGGPITVVQIAGQAAQTDFSSILSVLAFLSIQLGILNLLPIPILDGGHLFFYTFELIFRRPLSLRAREFAQQIGLVILILLMILAFYNDIVRIIGS